MWGFECRVVSANWLMVVVQHKRRDQVKSAVSNSRIPSLLSSLSLRGKFQENIKKEGGGGGIGRPQERVTTAQHVLRPGFCVPNNSSNLLPPTRIPFPSRQ